MNRVLGAMLIVAAGTLLGVSRAAELFRRVRLLEDLERTLRALEAGVRYGGGSLGELIAAESRSPLCRLALEDPEYSRDPRSALLRAGEQLFTSREDLDLLALLVSRLGETSVDVQLEHLALCRERARAVTETARARRDRNARLGVAAGAFGGVALCLILL